MATILDLEDEELEKALAKDNLNQLISGVGQDFKSMVHPFKRFWELQKQYSQQGAGLASPGEGDSAIKDVGTGVLGSALYTLSPVMSAFQAFRDEPIRDALMDVGVGRNKAELASLGIGTLMDIGGIGLAKKGLNISEEVARRVGPRGPNMGNIALGQEITRRSKVYQTEHPLGEWYGGDPMAKLKHLFIGMPASTLKNLGRRLVDPKASYIFSKYGIDHVPAEELKRLFEIQRRMERGESVPKLDKFGNETSEMINPVSGAATLRNEIHSQLAYIDHVFRKYLPDDKRRVAFERELVGDLYPNHYLTTADEIVGNAPQIRKILNIPEGISDEMIDIHLSPHIVGDYNLKGPVALNSKPFQQPLGVSWYEGSVSKGGKRDGKKYHARLQHPGMVESIRVKMGEHGIPYGVDKKPNPIDYLGAFQDLWSKMPSGTPLTKKNFLKSAEFLNEQTDRLAEQAYKKAAIEAKARVYKSSGPGRKKGDPYYSRERVEEIASAARQRVYDKRFYYDVAGLDKNIKEGGGAISIGQPSLSADRLLAHISNRIIIPTEGSQIKWRGATRRGDPLPGNEGIWVGYDQMKQGSGLKYLENALDMGSQYNFMAMDVVPISKRWVQETKKKAKLRKRKKKPTPLGTGYVSHWQGVPQEAAPAHMGIKTDKPAQIQSMKSGLGTRTVSDTIPGTRDEKALRIREATERMLYDRPDSTYLRNWLLPRIGGVGAVSAPTMSGMLTDDDKRKQRGGILAY